MNNLTKSLLALFLSALPAMAVEIAYPEASPLITFSIPEEWPHREDGGEFQAAASTDLETLLIIKPLKATKKEGSAAIAEIKAPLDKTYGDAIEYKKLQEGGTENLGLYVLNATAKTSTADEGEKTSHIVSVMITFPDSDELLLAQILTTQDGSEKNGEAIDAFLKSIAKAE